MNSSFQEDFQFLLKNLSDKNENVLSKAEQNENILRTKQALINVINIYITDFDKKYDSVLTPLFHMIELYIQQYSELFISADDLITEENQNDEKDFTNFLMSKMLMILSNPDIKSLHSYSCKIIILILETFSGNNQLEFFALVAELIQTLEDLNEFDKLFYDKNDLSPKVLNRFMVNSSALADNSDAGSKTSRRLIVIENPAYCFHLQENITFILREVCFQFINLIHDKLYDKLWYLLCEQLKYGEVSVKISSNLKEFLEYIQPFMRCSHLYA